MPHEINEEDSMMAKKAKEKYTGPRVKDTETFIQKARWAHGDKYDYSKVEYVNAQTKVKIMCETHGLFLQTPNNHTHVAGYGCPDCGRETISVKKRKPADWFLNSAREVHGDKYDYSAVKFEGAQRPVEIKCPTHGPFMQSPNVHINHGCGCPRCGVTSSADSRRKTKEYFIKRAQDVHGDKYDYSNSDYKRADQKILIKCPSHGYFHTTPNNHISAVNGGGCVKCRYEASSKSLSSNTERFILSAKEVHGDLYDYGGVVYKNSGVKVKIRCPAHGNFYQTPSTHLSGGGCQECGKERVIESKRKDIEWFIDEATKVHGDKYDYSLVEYKDTKQKVKISCGDHGVFSMSPANHIYHRQECPYCRGLTNDKNPTEWFIDKATNIFGDRFDYSNVIYIDCKKPVEIVCPTHGIFYQTPSNHMTSKHGCPNCSIEATSEFHKLSTEDFVSRSREVHGDKYDYTPSVYNGGENAVTINCPTHGNFEKKARSHLSGFGCPDCSRENYQWNSNSAYGLLGYYGTSAESNIYVLKINDEFIKVGLAKDISSRLYYINYESNYPVEKLYSVSGKANELFELEQKILRKSNLKRFYPEVSFGGQSECLELSELPKVLKIIKEWEEEQKSEEDA